MAYSMPEERVQESFEAALGGVESVRVELPWAPLPHKEGAYLTQLVLKERVHEVENALELYLRCQRRPIIQSGKQDELTLLLWRVLQAAHPHPLWQWGNWEEAYEQFRAKARERLSRAA